MKSKLNLKAHGRRLPPPSRRTPTVVPHSRSAVKRRERALELLEAMKRAQAEADDAADEAEAGA